MKKYVDEKLGITEEPKKVVAPKPVSATSGQIAAETGLVDTPIKTPVKQIKPPTVQREQILQEPDTSKAPSKVETKTPGATVGSMPTIADMNRLEESKYKETFERVKSEVSKVYESAVADEKNKVYLDPTHYVIVDEKDRAEFASQVSKPTVGYYGATIDNPAAANQQTFKNVAEYAASKGKTVYLEDNAKVALIDELSKLTPEETQAYLEQWGDKSLTYREQAAKAYLQDLVNSGKDNINASMAKEIFSQTGTMTVKDLSKGVYQISDATIERLNKDTAFLTSYWTAKNAGNDADAAKILADAVGNEAMPVVINNIPIVNYFNTPIRYGEKRNAQWYDFAAFFEGIEKGADDAGIFRDSMTDAEWYEKLIPGYYGAKILLGGFVADVYNTVVNVGGKAITDLNRNFGGTDEGFEQTAGWLFDALRASDAYIEKRQSESQKKAYTLAYKYGLVKTDGEFMNRVFALAQPVGESIGFMAPSILAGIATGGISAGATAAQTASLTTMGVNVFNRTYGENITNGYDYKTAATHAFLVAGIEIATEKMFPTFNGIDFSRMVGNATAEEAIKSVVSRTMRTPLMSAFMDLVQDVFEEGTEEYVSEVLGAGAENILKYNNKSMDQYGVFNNDAMKYNGDFLVDMLSDMGRMAMGGNNGQAANSFMMGAITAGVMQTAQLSVAKAAMQSFKALPIVYMDKLVNDMGQYLVDTGKIKNFVTGEGVIIFQKPGTGSESEGSEIANTEEVYYKYKDTETGLEQLSAKIAEMKKEGYEPQLAYFGQYDGNNETVFASKFGLLKKETTDGTTQYEVVSEDKVLLQTFLHEVFHALKANNADVGATIEQFYRNYGHYDAFNYKKAVSMAVRNTKTNEVTVREPVYEMRKDGSMVLKNPIPSIYKGVDDLVLGTLEHAMYVKRQTNRIYRADYYTEERIIEELSVDFAANILMTRPDLLYRMLADASGKKNIGIVNALRSVIMRKAGENSLKETFGGSADKTLSFAKDGAAVYLKEYLERTLAAGQIHASALNIYDEASVAIKEQIPNQSTGLLSKSALPGSALYNENAPAAKSIYDKKKLATIKKASETDPVVLVGINGLPIPKKVVRTVRYGVKLDMFIEDAGITSDEKKVIDGVETTNDVELRKALDKATVLVEKLNVTVPTMKNYLLNPAVSVIKNENGNNVVSIQGNLTGEMLFNTAKYGNVDYYDNVLGRYRSFTDIGFMGDTVQEFMTSVDRSNGITDRMSSEVQTVNTALFNLAMIKSNKKHLLSLARIVRDNPIKGVDGEALSNKINKVVAHIGHASMNTDAQTLSKMANDILAEGDTVAELKAVRRAYSRDVRVQTYLDRYAKALDSLKLLKDTYDSGIALYDALNDIDDIIYANDYSGADTDDALKAEYPTYADLNDDVRHPGFYVEIRNILIKKMPDSAPVRDIRNIVKGATNYEYTIFLKPYLDTFTEDTILKKDDVIWNVFKREPQMSVGISKDTRYSEHMFSGKNNYRIFDMEARSHFLDTHGKGNVRPHFSQHSFAHVLMTDVFDQNGKPGLFVEESQSDVHQAGSRGDRGYQFGNAADSVLKLYDRLETAIKTEVKPLFRDLQKEIPNRQTVILERTHYYNYEDLSGAFREGFKKGDGEVDVIMNRALTRYGYISRVKTVQDLMSRDPMVLVDYARQIGPNELYHKVSDSSDLEKYVKENYGINAKFKFVDLTETVRKLYENGFSPQDDVENAIVKTIGKDAVQLKGYAIPEDEQNKEQKALGMLFNGQRKENGLPQAVSWVNSNIDPVDLMSEIKGKDLSANYYNTSRFYGTFGRELDETNDTYKEQYTSDGLVKRFGILIDQDFENQELSKVEFVHHLEADHTKPYGVKPVYKRYDNLRSTISIHGFNAYRGYAIVKFAVEQRKTQYDSNTAEHKFTVVFNAWPEQNNGATPADAINIMAFQQGYKSTVNSYSQTDTLDILGQTEEEIVSSMFYTKKFSEFDVERENVRKAIDNVSDLKLQWQKEKEKLNKFVAPYPFMGNAWKVNNVVQTIKHGVTEGYKKIYFTNGLIPTLRWFGDSGHQRGQGDPNTGVITYFDLHQYHLAYETLDGVASDHNAKSYKIALEKLRKQALELAPTGEVFEDSFESVKAKIVGKKAQTNANLMVNEMLKNGQINKNDRYDKVNEIMRSEIDRLNNDQSIILEAADAYSKISLSNSYTDILNDIFSPNAINEYFDSLVSVDANIYHYALQFRTDDESADGTSEVYFQVDLYDDGRFLETGDTTLLEAFIKDVKLYDYYLDTDEGRQALISDLPKYRKFILEDANHELPRFKADIKKWEEDDPNHSRLAQISTGDTVIDAGSIPAFELATVIPNNGIGLDIEEYRGMHLHYDHFTANAVMDIGKKTGAKVGYEYVANFKTVDTRYLKIADNLVSKVAVPKTLDMLRHMFGLEPLSVVDYDYLHKVDNLSRTTDREQKMINAFYNFLSTDEGRLSGDYEWEELKNDVIKNWYLNSPLNRYMVKEFKFSMPMHLVGTLIDIYSDPHNQERALDMAYKEYLRHAKEVGALELTKDYKKENSLRGLLYQSYYMSEGYIKDYMTDGTFKQVVFGKPARYLYEIFAPDGNDTAPSLQYSNKFFELMARGMIHAKNLDNGGPMINQDRETVIRFMKNTVEKQDQELFRLYGKRNELSNDEMITYTELAKRQITEFIIKQIDHQYGDVFFGDMSRSPQVLLSELVPLLPIISNKGDQFMPLSEAGVGDYVFNDKLEAFTKDFADIGGNYSWTEKIVRIINETYSKLMSQADYLKTLSQWFSEVAVYMDNYEKFKELINRDETFARDLNLRTQDYEDYVQSKYFEFAKHYNEINKLIDIFNGEKEMVDKVFNQVDAIRDFIRIDLDPEFDGDPFADIDDEEYTGSMRHVKEAHIDAGFEATGKGKIAYLKSLNAKEYDPVDLIKSQVKGITRALYIEVNEKVAEEFGPDSKHRLYSAIDETSITEYNYDIRNMGTALKTLANDLQSRKNFIPAMEIAAFMNGRRHEEDMARFLSDKETVSRDEIKSKVAEYDDPQFASKILSLFTQKNLEEGTVPVSMLLAVIKSDYIYKDQAKWSGVLPALEEVYKLDRNKAIKVEELDPLLAKIPVIKANELSTKSEFGKYPHYYGYSTTSKVDVQGYAGNKLRLKPEGEYREIVLSVNKEATGELVSMLDMHYSQFNNLLGHARITIGAEHDSNSIDWSKESVVVLEEIQTPFDSKRSVKAGTPAADKATEFAKTVNDYYAKYREDMFNNSSRYMKENARIIVNDKGKNFYEETFEGYLASKYGNGYRVINRQVVGTEESRKFVKYTVAFGGQERTIPVTEYDTTEDLKAYFDYKLMSDATSTLPANTAQEQAERIAYGDKGMADTLFTQLANIEYFTNEPIIELPYSNPTFFEKELLTKLFKDAAAKDGSRFYIASGIEQVDRYKHDKKIIKEVLGSKVNVTVDGDEISIEVNYTEYENGKMVDKSKYMGFTKESLIETQNGGVTIDLNENVNENYRKMQELWSLKESVTPQELSAIRSYVNVISSSNQRDIAILNSIGVGEGLSFTVIRDKTNHRGNLELDTSWVFSDEAKSLQDLAALYGTDTPMRQLIDLAYNSKYFENVYQKYADGDHYDFNEIMNGVSRNDIKGELLSVRLERFSTVYDERLPEIIRSQFSNFGVQPHYVWVSVDTKENFESIVNELAGMASNDTLRNAIKQITYDPRTMKWSFKAAYDLANQTRQNKHFNDTMAELSVFVREITEYMDKELTPTQYRQHMYDYARGENHGTFMTNVPITNEMRKSVKMFSAAEEVAVAESDAENIRKLFIIGNPENENYAIYKDMFKKKEILIRKKKANLFRDGGFVGPVEDIIDVEKVKKQWRTHTAPYNVITDTNGVSRKEYASVDVGQFSDRQELITKMTKWLNEINDPNHPRPLKHLFITWLLLNNKISLKYLTFTNKTQKLSSDPSGNTKVYNNEEKAYLIFGDDGNFAVSVLTNNVEGRAFSAIIADERYMSNNLRLKSDTEFLNIGKNSDRFTMLVEKPTAAEYLRALKVQAGTMKPIQSARALVNISQLEAEINDPNNEVATGGKYYVSLNNKVLKQAMEVDDVDMYKERRHEKTIIKSGEVSKRGAGQVEKMIQNGEFDYVVMSDRKSLDYAVEVIGKDLDKAYQDFESAFRSNRRMTKNDIAIGEMLIKEISRPDSGVKNKTTKIVKLISDLASLGTELGQAVQALSLINKLSAHGQLLHLKRVTERMERMYLDNGFKGKKKVEFIYDDTLVENLLKQTDPAEIEKAVDAIKADLTKQVPNTWFDKLNAWRYLSMLGNVRTHLRNIVGNLLMLPMIRAKDIVAAGGEVFIPQTDRTKAVLVSSEFRDFAKQDFKDRKEVILGGGKYDTKTELERNKRIFKNNILEGVRKLNFAALEFEDAVFSQMHYVHAMAGFLASRKIDLANITPEQLEQARTYAQLEAQKGTFRDASKFANLLNHIERTNKKAGFVMAAVIPFKKTPINIVKRGMEYSPIGLIDTLTRQAFNLATNRITPAEFIDRLATGMTGTGVLALGYMLYGLGWLELGPKPDDNDKEKYFMGMIGVQNYSIVVGGKSYTIDWAVPAALPLIVGAELGRYLDETDGGSLFNVVPSLLLSMFDPLFELTMLQGITDTFQSFSGSGAALAGEAMTTMASNYIGQFIPTILGQIARVIDPIRRTTYAPKDSQWNPVAETIVRKLMSKIPYLSTFNEPVINVFGEEEQNNEGRNWYERTLWNMVSVGYYKDGQTGSEEDAILQIFNKTMSLDVLPRVAPKSFTVGGQTIILSGPQKTEFARTMGGTSKDLVGEFIDLSDYQSLSTDDKITIYGKIYDYAYALAKSGVSDYTDKWFEKVKGAIGVNISPIKYFIGEMIYESTEATDDKTKEYAFIDQLAQKDFSAVQIRYMLTAKGYKISSKDNAYIGEKVR